MLGECLLAEWAGGRSPRGQKPSCARRQEAFEQCGAQGPVSRLRGTSCDQKSNRDSWGVGVGIHRGPLREWGLYCSSQNCLLFVSFEYFAFLSLGIQALAFLVGVVTD